MEDGSMYLKMAESFTNDNEYNSSDEEPLSRKRQAHFYDSDDEPLSKLCQKRSKETCNTIGKMQPPPEASNATEMASQYIEGERLIHQHRLDNLLSANGLTRRSIQKDGNCFFTAAATFLDISASELRQLLCDFLDKNSTFYLPYISAEDGQDESDRFLCFFLMVHELRGTGVWCNDIGDLRPRILADWSRREVRIYSSNPLKSFINILPSMDNILPSQKNNDAILLAYFDNHPQHYDVCMTLSVQTHDLHFGQNKRQEHDHGNPTSSEHFSQEDNIDNNSNQTTEVEHVLSISPRRQGSFNSPPKQNDARKRLAKPSSWKKNVRKQLHLQGKEYTSRSGKVVSAKQMSNVDCSKCKFGCNRIVEEQRRNVFQTFYSLTTSERQKDFVCSNVREKDTNQCQSCDNTLKSKVRGKSRAFYLTVNGCQERVCKRFFLATLAVGESYVDHALKNCSNGTYSGNKRNGKVPHNKTSEKDLNAVREHIKSFPSVESHYTRKDTRRLYLDANLSISKMYDLFKDKRNSVEETAVSKKTYSAVFDTEFNLSFHTPKKDQCPNCVGYTMKVKSGLETEKDKQEHTQHQQRKEAARREKEKDKQEAKTDSSKFVCTMDLQAVLQAPCGLVGPLYYKRKLCVYNFTIYDLASGRGTCYTWDETEGKRGSCEIATCIYHHLSSLPNTVNSVILYSDCCSGQNRNQYLTTALIHAVNHIYNIQNITHKYLETGDTQMECDSMHAAITFAKKSTPIFTPTGWDIVLRMARRHNPYIVIPLKHTDFIDFKTMAATIMKNTKTDIHGNRVSWLKFKAICVLKGQEDVIQYKYSFEDNWTMIKVMGSSKRGRPSLTPVADMPKSYTTKLAISEAKKRDLLSLCQCNPEIIPMEHHDYYRSLPSTNAQIHERLPEPDMAEDECDSD